MSQHIDNEYANNYMINGQSAQNQQGVVVNWQCMYFPIQSLSNFLNHF